MRVSFCFRSMKKNGTPHTINTSISLTSKSLSGKCSCVAAKVGNFSHAIGLLFLSHIVRNFLKVQVPAYLTSTSMKQQWSILRGRKIKQSKIEEVLLKKPQASAEYRIHQKQLVFTCYIIPNTHQRIVIYSYPSVLSYQQELS